MNDATVPRRALDAGQKQVKREAILLAARQLYEDSPGELPSAAAIAERAGLAKGTVYLYFRSKEDIFLSLLSEEFSVLLGEIRRGLETVGGSNDQLVELFASGYVGWLRGRPLLLRLTSLSPGSLMRGATPDCWLDMRRRLHGDMKSVAGLINTRTCLSLVEAEALLIKGYALTVGLYQTVDLPQSRGNRLDREPLAGDNLDFWCLLDSGMRQLWRGALDDCQRSANSASAVSGPAASRPADASPDGAY